MVNNKVFEEIIEGLKMGLIMIVCASVLLGICYMGYWCDSQDEKQSLLNSKTIYTIKIGESITKRVDMWDGETWTRVPGGWTLNKWTYHSNNTVFVPYISEVNNE